MLDINKIEYIYASLQLKFFIQKNEGKIYKNCKILNKLLNNDQL